VDESRSGDPLDTGCASCLGRRSLLRGAAGLAGAALVSGAVSGEATAAPGGRWTTLGPVTDVSVGTSEFYPNHGDWTVVARPQRREWRAYDGRCPHQAQQVTGYDRPARQLVCPGHGSRFRMRNGAVVQGPATSPLIRKEIRIREGNIQVR